MRFPLVVVVVVVVVVRDNSERRRQNTIIALLLTLVVLISSARLVLSSSSSLCAIIFFQFEERNQLNLKRRLFMSRSSRSLSLCFPVYIKTRALSLKPVLRTIARRIFASDRPVQTERVQNERPQGLQNALFLLEMCGNFVFRKAGANIDFRTVF